MVTSSQWKPSGEDSMTSIWNFRRSSSSSWHLWVLLHLSGPTEEFWNLKRTSLWRLSRKTCDKKLRNSKLRKLNNRKDILRLISPEKTAVDANEKKTGASTAQGLWQHTLLRAAETNLEILTLGGIEHVSITFLQRRKTPKRLPKNGKQTMRVCDFNHWLNSSVEPWNACAHNMKLIHHDLKDKWIQDNGATNHMTANQELLDGTTFQF